MPKKKYLVILRAEERAQLRTVITKGKQSARMIRRAHILLLAAEGQTDEQIAHALHLGRATVERTRRRFQQDRLQALQERPRPGAKSKLDGKQAAHLIALACSTPPAGRHGWTMQLLADRLVARGVVETISDETVRRVLKKTQ